MIDRIERLKTFLKESPDDCFINHALALEFVKLQDDATAKAYFEKNYQFDPSYVATYYHLGKLLERLQQPTDALRIYEEGMQAAKKAGDQHSYNELQGAYDDLL